MQWLFRHDGFLFWCYLLKKRRLGWIVQETAKWADGSDTPLCRCVLVDGLERWGCSCRNKERRRLGQWPTAGLTHIFVIIGELISCSVEKGNYCLWTKILGLPSYIVAPKIYMPIGVLKFVRSMQVMWYCRIVCDASRGRMQWEVWVGAHTVCIWSTARWIKKRKERRWISKLLVSSPSSSLWFRSCDP